MKTAIILLMLAVFLVASLFVNGCAKKTTVDQDSAELDSMISDIGNTDIGSLNLGLDNVSNLDNVDVSGLV